MTFRVPSPQASDRGPRADHATMDGGAQTMDGTARTLEELPAAVVPSLVRVIILAP